MNERGGLFFGETDLGYLVQAATETDGIRNLILDKANKSYQCGYQPHISSSPTQVPTYSVAKGCGARKAFAGGWEES